MTETRQKGPEFNPRSVMFHDLLDEPSLGVTQQRQLDCDLAGFRMLQLALKRTLSVSQADA